LKTDEWLDEVNEHDEVLGPRRRSDIHRLKLRHRSVHLLVFDERGQVFLQRRSPHKDVNPGLWDTSAAGHVDAGEEVLTAAYRELEEELGLIPTNPLEFLLKLEANAETGWEFISLFKTIAEKPVTLDPDEILEGQWIQASQLDEWIDHGGDGLTLTFMRIWHCYRSLIFKNH